jgi:hypothetical protein
MIRRSCQRASLSNGAYIGAAMVFIRDRRGLRSRWLPMITSHVRRPISKTALQRTWQGSGFQYKEREGEQR